MLMLMHYCGTAVVAIKGAALKARTLSAYHTKNFM